MKWVRATADIAVTKLARYGAVALFPLRGFALRALTRSEVMFVFNMYRIKACAPAVDLGKALFATFLIFRNYP
jgi:hypothetical protein